jgi:hypothetical protein
MLNTGCLKIYPQESSLKCLRINIPRLNGAISLHMICTRNFLLNLYSYKDWYHSVMLYFISNCTYFCLRSQWLRGLKGPIHVRVWLASPTRVWVTKLGVSSCVCGEINPSPAPESSSPSRTRKSDSYVYGPLKA